MYVEGQRHDIGIQLGSISNGTTIYGDYDIAKSVYEAIIRELGHEYTNFDVVRLMATCIVDPRIWMLSSEDTRLFCYNPQEQKTYVTRTITVTLETLNYQFLSVDTVAALRIQLQEQGSLKILMVSDTGAASIRRLASPPRTTPATPAIETRRDEGCCAEDESWNVFLYALCINVFCIFQPWFFLLGMLFHFINGITCCCKRGRGRIASCICVFGFTCLVIMVGTAVGITFLVLYLRQG